MHEKTIKYLHTLKEQFKKECTCKGRGCTKCDKKISLYSKMALANIPVKYWDFELDNIENTKSLEKSKKYINNIEIAYKDGLGLFLCGKNGSGKTLAACLIGKEGIKKGYTTRFTFLNEIISAFTDSMYNKELREELQKDILGVDFLILDDIDKCYLGKDSQYINSILDNLFRQRVQNNLPMLITANKTMEEILKSQDSTYSKSLLSLFNESVQSIVFLEGDYRDKIKSSIKEKIFS